MLYIRVASFTDAWIETVNNVFSVTEVSSHLLQMRGLKHFSLNRELHGHESHLLQMRGLKQKRCATSTSAQSRIFYRCVD